MAPAYKLFYFPIRGWAEPIRFLLSYGEIEFEDFRFGKDEWPQLKEQMPFGQVPVLEHNGRKVGQSVAIARYIAKQVKLVGKDDWENLEIDAMVDSINDFCLKLASIRRETDEEKRKVLKETAINETLPYTLKRFDDIAEKNNGYLAVGRLTWADLYFTSTLQGIDLVAGYDVLSEYPYLSDLKNKVLTIPAIKKWIETRPESEF